MTQIVGIVNLTEDSFSDGGEFLDTSRAVAHGEKLLADGADWLDLGAESSNPFGKKVPAEVEIERLRPLIRHFKARGTRISVDTYKSGVIRAALDLGADMINDITALRDPASVDALLQHPRVPVVLMHSRSAGPRAETKERPYRALHLEIIDFFRSRLGELESAGFSRQRAIVDPGMGFFLGGNPEPSLWMLRHLETLKALERPILISTSRKSFIGALLDRNVSQRAVGTLASELWAIQRGTDYVRTHDVSQLSQAYRVWRAIAEIA
jgi:dihydropteroate synthase